MGMHTWFVKSHELLLKTNEIWKASDKAFDEDFDNDAGNRLYAEAEELDNQNKADYHDVFRSNVRVPGSTEYDTTILSSMDQTVNYINKHNLHLNMDTNAWNLLKKFWNDFPEGAIYFG